MLHQPLLFRERSPLGSFGQHNMRDGDEGKGGGGEDDLGGRAVIVIVKIIFSRMHARNRLLLLRPWLHARYQIVRPTFGAQNKTTTSAAECP